MFAICCNIKTNLLVQLSTTNWKGDLKRVLQDKQPNPFGLNYEELRTCLEKLNQFI